MKESFWSWATVAGFVLLFLITLFFARRAQNKWMAEQKKDKKDQQEG